jgi:hypothetical protein
VSGHPSVIEERAFGFNAADIQTTGLVIDNFNFWRATVGLAAKF